MTQEYKDLLLKDICARLPYGVKFQSENIETALFVDTSDDEVWINGTCIDDFKPYLFPLSSMTEEQKKELKILCDWCDDKKDAYSILVLYQEYFIMKSDVIDWCYKNHLDINDLIPKGLALDATGLNIY